MLAIGVVLVALARAVSAQEATAPPDDLQANPGRPTIATPATLTPVGYLQLENGVLNAHTSGDFSKLVALNQVTKLAINSRVQLIGQFEPAAWSQGSGQSRLAGHAGGISAGAQILLLPGHGSKPSVAVSYLQTVFSGSAADLDVGSARQSFLALVSCDLGAFHVDTNAFFNDQLDVSRKLQSGQTLSISHPLGSMTVVGELWHFTQPFVAGDAVGVLWALSYAPTKHLVLDGGFDKGATATSTHWEFFGGVTYLVPHRLWASPHP